MSDETVYRITGKGRFLLMLMNLGVSVKFEGEEDPEIHKFFTFLGKQAVKSGAPDDYISFMLGLFAQEGLLPDEGKETH